MPKYGYLPEWKICFWKKIILDKEWITSHRHSLQSLQAFPDADLRSEIIKSQDAIIDEIHSKIPVVLSSKSARDYLKTQIVSPGRTKDAWFFFLIENARDSLFELAYLVPPALEIIDILLDRVCIDEYRRGRKEFERIELNKSVGIMGNNRDSPAVVTKTIAWKLYLTDPHCELGNIVYKKTLRGEFLTQDETRILLKNNSGLPITFGLKINDDVLKQKVDEYIDNFIQQDLMPEKDVLYFSVDQQRHNLLDAIQRIVPSYGYKNIFLSLQRVMKINGLDRSTAEQHRFFEGMFSLEHTGEIKIDNLRGDGEVVFSLTSTGLALLERNSIIETLLAEDKFVECHYSQTVLIKFKHNIYKPRAKKCKELLKKLFEFFATNEKKPCRLEAVFGPMDTEQKKFYIRDTKAKLHNINRQLHQKKIPLILDMDNAAIWLTAIKDEVEIEFI